MSTQPKRPPPPRGPPPPRDTREDVELPFDDHEVTPLRADDPRPQRVPQFPAQARRNRPDSDDTDIIRVRPEDLGGAIPEPEYRPVFLYVEKGPGAGQLVPVRQGRLVLGRSSTADLRLQHPSVSRRHAELRREGEHFYLKDLGSQNGTYVNKAKVAAERELNIGDAIALGTAVLRLRGPVGAQEQLGPPPKSRGVRLALFATAVGFGLSAIFLYALLKMQATPEPPTLAVSGPRPLPGAIAQAAPPPKVDLPVYQSAPQETAPAVKTEPVDPPVPATETAESAEPSEPAEPPRHKSPAHHVAAKPPHHAAAHEKPHAQIAAPHAVAEAREPAPAPVQTRDPMVAYRAGQLRQAVELANAQDPNLAAKLSRFDSVYGQARKALAAHDLDTAKRRLTTALALDEDLAQGGGRLNATIRADLEKIGAIDGDAASTPDARPPPKPSRATAKSAIDAAFGD